MAWYSTGTIQVAAGGTVATGTGTAFLGNVRVGDGITIAGSTAQHEVIGVTSDTQLTFSPAYSGTAGSGKAYRIVPVNGYDKDLSDAFNAIRLTWGTTLASLQPWAYASSAAVARTQLGLGTASTANLQASSTDNTSNRVLTTGSANILTFSASEGFEILKGSRFLRTGSDGPIGSTICGGISIGVTASIEQQLAARLGRIFFRSLGDPQNDWRELFHNRNILGTVSQSGGIPTGSIIERGSNSNGEYVRFADGTQICWSPIIVDNTASITIAAAGGFRGNATGWTFPASFSTTPVVSCFSRTSNNLILGLRVLNSTTVQPDYWAATSNASVGAGYQAIAIGRWF